MLEIPPSPAAAAAGAESVYMWGGDRWQSAPDKFKSHDFMVWVPFRFADEEGGGAVEPLSYNKTWELALG